MLPTKRTIAGFVIMLALAALAAGAFIALRGMFLGKVSSVVSRKAEIALVIGKTRALSAMQTSLADSASNAAALAAYIVPQNGIVDFITTLDSIIATSGVKADVGSIGVTAGGAPAGMELVDVKASATGAWNNIEYFLTLLETYPLKIDIRSASMRQFSSYTVRGRQVPQWSLDVEFTVLKLKDN
ncbi:MAG: hypothetical protein KGH93_00635 [Patescibacteria group bacterium]|nr:hypothetical protein [Patescibacteria group bacterium]MDE1945693.1 hypothetical protein [Patescibacteria group bacterium]